MTFPGWHLALASLVGCLVWPAAAHSADQITAEFYQNSSCTGTPYKVPYTLGQCYNGGYNHTGVVYSDKTDNATCFTISLFPPNDDKCRSRGVNTSRYQGACGVCTHDPDPTVARYIWECHPEQEYVVRRVQCNEDCSYCGVKTIIGKSGCVPVGGTVGSLRFDELFACSYVAKRIYYSNATTVCAQSTPRSYAACGECDYGMRLVC